MYLSEEERKEILSAYGIKDFISVDFQQVDTDSYIYLFESEGKKLILVSADYLGDFEFDSFPHLLKFNGGRLEFVLQREIAVLDAKNEPHAMLFEYTD